MDLGIILFYQPIFNLLVVFYRLFGGNLGLGIIAIAFLFRLVTFPITRRQARMLRENQELSDKVAGIKEQYKNDKKKQTEEMAKVQTEYLPGQLQGCLSMILQFIVLINVFNVVRNFLTAEGSSNFSHVAYPFVPTFGSEPINVDFLGIKLTESATTLGYDDIGRVLPYVLLAIGVGVVQFYSTKLLMSTRKNNQTEEEQTKAKEKSKRKAGDEPDFAEILKQTTSQTTYMLPILISVMSLSFPAGLSIYWTAQSTFVIIQQLITARLESNESN